MSEYEDANEAMTTIMWALKENPTNLMAGDDIAGLVRFGLTADRTYYDGDDLAAIVLLKDGRYAALEGGSDYTGWDCQSDLDVSIHDTAEDAWRDGITNDGRALIERHERWEREA